MKPSPCTDDQSLTLSAGGRRRAPAMAVGLTDQHGSGTQLLEYPVPLPRWQPPKKRGRRSKELTRTYSKVGDMTTSECQATPSEPVQVETTPRHSGSCA